MQTRRCVDENYSITWLITDKLGQVEYIIIISQ